MDTLPITTPRQAGIYVRQARESQGITRAALAKKAGVSERLLASLELGDATGIRLDKLLAIFNALGLALAAQGDIAKTNNEQSVNAPHADLQPRSTPRRHHAQRPSHRNRRSTAIPALADAPFTSALYDEVFADFAMSNLGVSIAANDSAQVNLEGGTAEHFEH
ncbi:helix-turn-helix domain-containing protein [Collinsella aerofaciens]|uniref:helix-turn-helix domain-containing protein n=1 Tax=Collinsella aerofaciens TaxID=74426 RepID=UPI001E2F8238|nr:helix-turn-helix transcriptional regulator [Collinsella aerofaciens]MDB1862742.1 helix-turn-helix transcriptional regulator [Collinsella aerofaciens]